MNEHFYCFQDVDGEYVTAGRMTETEARDYASSHNLAASKDMWSPTQGRAYSVIVFDFTPDVSHLTPLF